MNSSNGTRGVQDLRPTDCDELAAAAHELKTPIAVALALCASAAETNNPIAMRRDIGRIAANVRAVREQLDVLLDAERLRGDTALRLERVNIAALVREAATRFTCVAARRRVTVAVEAPADLAAVVDRDRLGVAVRNLIANAVRHARDGGIVRLRLSELRHRGRARLEVADDGPGVPEALRDAVFERYRRFDGGGRSGGSGIGLAVVREIALAHGGDIAVGGAPEGGALFALELPLAPAAVDAA